MSVKPTEIRKKRGERQRGFKTYYYRTYTAPVGATLADLSLERGDSLPDNADAIITEATMKPVEEGVEHTINVIAMKQQTGA